MPRKPDPDRMPHPGRTSAERHDPGRGNGAPTQAHILTLLDGIERHGENSPGAIGFRSALNRAGREADAAGGLSALVALMDAVAAADPARADARTAILRGAWGELLPGPGGKARS